jgi:hypothetical protein
LKRLQLQEQLAPTKVVAEAHVVNVFVAIIGWIIVAEGLLGIARPHLMLTAVLSWSPDLCFYVTVGSRIIIGLLLVLAAPRCRLPRFTRAIGVITFVTGVVYAFIGARRLDSILQSMSAQPNWIIQLLYALAILLGALLIYSGSKKRVV